MTSESTSNPPSNPARIALLRQGSTPSLEPSCPALATRWLHSKEKVWKPFGVLDSKNLDSGFKEWNTELELSRATQDDKVEIDQSEKEKESKSKGNGKGKGKDRVEEDEFKYIEPDPLVDLPSWRVPCMQDKMYEVDLRRNKVSPGPEMEE